MPYDLPINFQQRILDVHGAKGAAWLEKLPQILDQYQKEWQCKLLAPVKGLSFNLVYHALLADGTPIIFKTGVPSADFKNEICSLHAFAGSGAVDILHYSYADCVMLIEQAVPGTVLASLTLSGRDAEAVQICAHVMHQLHAITLPSSEAAKLPNLQDRIAEFAKIRTAIIETKADFSLQILAQAEQMYSDLVKSTTRTVLLHGDLHHENILSSTKHGGWVAIDPHGVIGDPIFEIAAFIRNPFPAIINLPNLQQLLSQRIKLFAKLTGYDAQRIWAWAFAQTVQSAGWSVIDKTDWQPSYQIAQLLLQIKPQIKPELQL